jgi:hypothetical protein
MRPDCGWQADPYSTKRNFLIVSQADMDAILSHGF